MRKIAYLLFFGLLLTFSIQQAAAIPSTDLRVIVIDPEAGGLGGSLTFSVVPSNNNISQINNVGALSGAERIAVFGGNAYVANVDKISRINLNAQGQPNPSLPSNNVEDITGAIFLSLTGIALDSNGMIYVADAIDNQIYSVNPAGAPSANNSLVSINTTFLAIRDITIDNNVLYILDTAAENGEGAIYKVDLTMPPLPLGYDAILVYSGISSESLAATNGMVVHNNEIFVSGTFSFGPGIIKINANSPYPAVEFSDNTNGELSFPFGLAIDTTGNDLYVSDNILDSPDLPSIYRFSLANTPSQPVLVTNNLLVAPAGLATLVISAPPADTQLTITKSVNATTALPGQGLLYTITATNIGPDPATSVRIHDFFPSVGTSKVESYLNQTNQLSFTAEVHDVSASTVIQTGHCERQNADLYIVICNSFGTLDAGDYVLVKLEGIISPGAQGALVNTAVVENFGTSAKATVQTDVNPSVVFSSVTKTSTPSTITAGSGSIDYIITVDNHGQDSANADGVIITDTLPNGVSSISITSEPSPNSCQILPQPNNPNQLRCGPYTISNNDLLEIHYTADVGPSSKNPLINEVNVTCANCAATQSTSTSTTILTESDLWLQKQVDKTSVIAGQDFLLYTITVTNDGPSDADHVIITDNLPSGVTFNVSASSPECSFDSQNNNAICYLTNPISPGESHVVTMNVTVNSSTTGTLPNTATVTSDSTDPNQANNQASTDPVDVISITDLSLSKTGPINTVAGRTITYNLSVTNHGPSDAVHVKVQDELPTGLTFIPYSAPNSLSDPNCQFSLGLVVCDFGNMQAGTTQTKSIQAQIALTVIGTIHNTAEVFTDTDDQNPDNNTAMLDTIVAAPFCGRAESDFANVIYGTEGKDNIKGTNQDDLIFGLGGDDKISGKDGNDCIIGGDGNDKIWSGKGNDGIEGNIGNDYLYGQDGNDTITGGDGDDKIWGGKGNDALDGNGGKDQIHGQQGIDTITGGDGDDKIWGGQDNDTINAGTGNDRVNANQGEDNVIGGDGNDWINAGIGNDVINAGLGDDKIFGMQGNDNLFGEAGDDIIHGGQGNDLLNGGPNNDQCNGAQGTNTFVDCESQKPMKEENEEAEEEEEHEDNDSHENDKDNKDKKKN
ncbi:DUF11 domain-containing protein [Candidatus Nitrosotenuis sp. DW1]|uniref:DUF11 domain-containing protein n=1 Tax=Candidatus Nitrosotenuis sp. DW1 TaxID=2259672 RepID=UPI0015CC9D7E|nr:DUF11 domain-containing protein [Candidatus Nitrosotenuis sp. DW1]QLH09770.1 hypothetical protein DSQ19_10140 [Candidatus Nitrosotenuis sp. DW1]